MSSDSETELTEEMADAVVLRALDYEKQEIARILDIHRNTVTRHLNRVRDMTAEGNEAVGVAVAAMESTRTQIPDPLSTILADGIGYALGIKATQHFSKMVEGHLRDEPVTEAEPSHDTNNEER